MPESAWRSWTFPSKCTISPNDVIPQHDYDSTRLSWNRATANHNAHKGDQAVFLRNGGDVLFPDELELLGSLEGRSLVHLQCNAGQDSLCLARRGANVTGVDLSDEAITFARNLSNASGIAAAFEHAEVVEWMASTKARFDLAFSSYGAAGWLPDLAAWAQGIARILKPGGQFVYVEFHPIRWSIGDDLKLSGDDYFASGAFHEPVGDYVASSGTSLGGQDNAIPASNDIPATSWQHTLAEIVDALMQAGFVLETLREYPYANGCRIHDALVAAPGRRWVWPQSVARTPLMFGLRVRRPER